MVDLWSDFVNVMDVCRYRQQAEEDIQSLKMSLGDSEAKSTVLEAETKKLQEAFEKYVNNTV